MITLRFKPSQCQRRRFMTTESPRGPGPNFGHLQQRSVSYLNLSGGRELYDPDISRAKGIVLRFLEVPEIRYEQLSDPFRAGLSIIDVLMFDSVKKIQSDFSSVIPSKTKDR